MPIYTITLQAWSTAVSDAVSLSMHYAATTWEEIKQSNWLMGVGSNAFPEKATALGVTPHSWVGRKWRNTHNEYLYMLATKGVLGMAMYLITLHKPWGKTDEVQRIGLKMLIFLFILSLPRRYDD